MEGVEVEGPAVRRPDTVWALWIAGSSNDVEQWKLQRTIPLTNNTPAWKGRYVGFRETAAQAIHRYKLRCKDYDEKDIRLMKIELDLKAFAEMCQEQVCEPGRGMVRRLLYQTFPGDNRDWGVWYYFGQSFDLNARGVKFGTSIDTYASEEIAGRHSDQRLAPTMAGAMEDVEVQGPAGSPTEMDRALWVAGSSKDVQQWKQQGTIPLTERAWKGSYVGFCDTKDQAAERYKQRCSAEGKPFNKEDIYLMKITLNWKDFMQMSQEKVYDEGRGKGSGVHYQTDLNSECEQGVWYYAGEPFNINARDVKCDVFRVW